MSKFKVGDTIKGWVRIVQVRPESYLVTNGIAVWEIPKEALR